VTLTAGWTSSYARSIPPVRTRHHLLIICSSPLTPADHLLRTPHSPLPSLPTDPTYLQTQPTPAFHPIHRPLPPVLPILPPGLPYPCRSTRPSDRQPRLSRSPRGPLVSPRSHVAPHIQRIRRPKSLRTRIQNRTGGVCTFCQRSMCGLPPTRCRTPPLCFRPVHGDPASL